jgi:hypothetical protein
MTTFTKRPTVKELRTEIERRGITDDSAGCSIEELIRKARATDDPSDFLEKFLLTKESREPNPSAANIAQGFAPETKTVPDETIPPADETPETESPEKAAENETLAEQLEKDRFENEGAPPIAEEPEPARTIGVGEITVPLGDLPMDQVEAGKIHVSRHLEVQLSAKEAVALRRITLGLDQSGEKIPSTGKRVVKAGDAIRWMLEKLEQIS